MPYKINCKYCGMLKITLRKNQKFCNIKCKGLYFSGENNPAYKGGKIKADNGYIRLRGKGGTHRYEHRIIMEKFLKRELYQNEEVHHINGIKDDNRLENLCILDKKDHSKKYFELILENARLKWKIFWLIKKIRGKI